MQIPLPFPPIVLTALLSAAYLWSVWWLLRNERRGAVLGLVAVTAIALGLRLYRVWDFPPGLNDDEFHTLHMAHSALRGWQVFGIGLNVPLFPTVLFSAPFSQMFDSVFWSMRTYAIAMGTLTIPVSFAIARSMTFGLTPSFVVAALVTTMPWSLFWGRFPSGGENMFFEALLVAALARILFSGGGKAEVWIGIFALSGMLYNYIGVWVFLGLPFVGVLLSSSRRQAFLCTMIGIGALVTWIPWLLQFEEWGGHIVYKTTTVSPSEAPSVTTVLGIQLEKIVKTFRVFVFPEGDVHWISLHSIALHPVVVLVVALLGILVVGWRRAAFLVVGFGLGVLPAIVSFHRSPSTHRIIGAFLFISLACGAFFHGVFSRSPRQSSKTIVSCLACLFVVVAGYEGVSTFIAPRFWEGYGDVFMHSRTLLAESIRLPTTRNLVVDRYVARVLEARGYFQPGFSILSYENALATRANEYALSPSVPELLRVFKDEVPSDQVMTYTGMGGDESVLLKVTDENAAQWQKYGWRVELPCSDTQRISAQIPVFMHQPFYRWTYFCEGAKEIVFRAVWTREATELKFEAFGSQAISIETSHGTRLGRTEGDAESFLVTLHPEEIVTVVLSVVDGGVARLVEVGPDGERLPRLGSFKPAALK